MKTTSRRNTLKILGAFSLATIFPLKVLSAALQTTCNICKDAWFSLHIFNRTRYQFRYIEPTPNLPKVFIYGDSISIGYTEYTRASLDGKACVYRLHENGASSNDFIRKMEALRKAMFQPSFKQGWNFQWDVIHFNVGLHDLKYLSNNKLNKEQGTQVSSLDIYDKNLRAIIKYLKKIHPNTKLIFATTTPVPEGEPGRIVGDANRYNKQALKVLKDHKDIVVNDLYEFSIPILEAHAAAPENVHYTSEGYRLQGIEVARIIANVIDVKTNDCPTVSIIEKRFKEYESIYKKKK